MAIKVNKTKLNQVKSNSKFYINKEGFMVFTEQYHLERGYCCKNGCLHCPYHFER